jgi:hypothetical protein
MTSPIPMRLCCEGCGKLHIDEGEFATKPHHTHSCQYCGLTWRPAVVHTVGVQFLPGFKNDAPVTKIKAFTGYSGPIEPGSTWQHIQNVGAPLLRVKGLGSYVSGGSRIDFTDGHSLEEQSFRTYYRPYSTGISKAETPFDAPTRSICCVVAGSEVLVECDENNTLGAVKIQALYQLKLDGHGPASSGNWEIRDVLGLLWRDSDQVKDVPSLQGCIKPTLYINPPVGSGG